MDLPPFVRAAEDGTTLDAFVQPGARRATIGGLHGEALKIKVTAPASDGAANRAVEQALAAVLDVPPSRVRVERGHGSRRKRIGIAGVPPENVAAALMRHLG